MRKLLNLMILFILLIDSAGFAEDSKTSSEPSDFMETLIAKVEIPGQTSFYGSGILIDVGPGTLGFVTNYHVLPPKEQRDRWIICNATIGGLRNHGYLAPEPDPALQGCAHPRVQASIPGYDLAFLMVDYSMEGSSRVLDVDAMNAEIRGAFVSAPDTGSIEAPAALVGYQDFSANRNEIEFKNWPWSHQGTAVHIRKTTDCPQLFSEHCLLTDIESGGFSGGILMIVDIHGQQKILGMVSDFGSFTPDTYAIPIGDIIQVLARVVLTHREAGWVQTQDLNGPFEWIAPHRIKITSGPLKDAEVSDFPQWSAAGGYSSGGGGYSSGGGGYSSGGGGFNSDYQARVLADSPLVFSTAARKDPHSFLRRLYRAEFKGADSYFDYSSGVSLMNGGVTQQIATQDGKSIRNLRDFISIYKEHGDSSPGFSDRFDPAQIPDQALSNSCAELGRFAPHLSSDANSKSPQWMTDKKDGGNYHLQALCAHERIEKTMGKLILHIASLGGGDILIVFPDTKLNHWQSAGPGVLNFDGDIEIVFAGKSYPAQASASWVDAESSENPASHHQLTVLFNVKGLDSSAGLSDKLSVDRDIGVFNTLWIPF